MIAQVVNTRYAYVVKVCLEKPGGNMEWETVDSHKWQYKAIELRDHLLKNEYKSVDEIYKSDYYMKWSGN